MDNLHPDDQPPATWRRDVSEGETEQAVHVAFTDPAFELGVLFCSLLKDPDVTAFELSQLVTPESLPQWGDFSGAIEWFRGIDDVGYGSNVDRALGDDAVAYFKVFSGTTSSYQVTDLQIMSGPGVLTLVNREGAGWRVHGVGSHIHPEQIPH
ncbi:hypothetical protein [Arthrobacter sp. U41]|uniref:hypothetical protein n=1 Tax=Arthrobacter sp. U41 TaxID=1849032 RepID=UPI0008596044|nr:hypothetical protein [Arthrobacter sp. U41]AOT04945.1 hypothetical protein ASPU41_18105 [Arthrobacter sp. U41]